MTSNFNSYNDEQQPPATDPTNQSPGSRLTIQRDRFELLSAYLDGEVTATERRQVEDWLAHDPTVQRLHSHLLKLRQGLQNLPVPSSPQSVQQTVDRVLNHVDRRPQMRLFWGGAAIAALFVGALMTVVPGDRSPVPQIAQSPQQPVQLPSQPETTAEPLLIALDKPLVAIPKAPVANPNSLRQPAEIHPKSDTSVR
jgi:hypothetical protein